MLCINIATQILVSECYFTYSYQFITVQSCPHGCRRRQMITSQMITRDALSIAYFLSCWQRCQLVTIVLIDGGKQRRVVLRPSLFRASKDSLFQVLSYRNTRQLTMELHTDLLTYLFLLTKSASQSIAIVLVERLSRFHFRVRVLEA